MKWQLRQSIMLLLLTVGCASTFAQNTNLSERDYAVLSDFFDSQLAGKSRPDAITVGAKGSVIAPTTLSLKPLDGALRNWLMKDLKGLTADTIKSLGGCAERRMIVKHAFDLPVEYELALPEETKDFRALYARHPHTNGYIQFSCVGVNSAGTQALFFLERLMTPSAVGKWVLMEKGSSGSWVLKHERVSWIS
jgi:hypothetical protein